MPATGNGARRSPTGGAHMRIIALFTDAAPVERILKVHLRGYLRQMASLESVHGSRSSKSTRNALAMARNVPMAPVLVPASSWEM